MSGGPRSKGWDKAQMKECVDRWMADGDRPAERRTDGMSKRSCQQWDSPKLRCLGARHFRELYSESVCVLCVGSDEGVALIPQSGFSNTLITWTGFIKKILQFHFTWENL